MTFNVLLFNAGSASLKGEVRCLSSLPASGASGVTGNETIG
jgi:hypothetical protein